MKKRKPFTRARRTEILLRKYVLVPMYKRRHRILSEGLAGIFVLLLLVFTLVAVVVFVRRHL